MILANTIPEGSSRSFSKSAFGILLSARILATVIKEVALTSAARVLSIPAIEQRRLSISLIPFLPAIGAQDRQDCL